DALVQRRAWLPGQLPGSRSERRGPARAPATIGTGAALTIRATQEAHVQRKTFRFAAVALVLALLGVGLAPNDGGQALAANAGASFTYLGNLQQGGTPVDNSCDMQLQLFDSASSGTQVGSTLTYTDVSD